MAITWRLAAHLEIEMTTLAEKIASLSPELREMVEREAEELIAQERARRAGLLSKRRSASGKSRRSGQAAKYSYASNVGVTGLSKRVYRQARRAGRGRLRRAGHRRYLIVAR